MPAFFTVEIIRGLQNGSGGQNIFYVISLLGVAGILLLFCCFMLWW
jgi:Na+/melibiose symporter-like transporter